MDNGNVSVCVCVCTRVLGVNAYMHGFACVCLHVCTCMFVSTNGSLKVRLEMILYHSRFLIEAESLSETQNLLIWLILLTSSTWGSSVYTFRGWNYGLAATLTQQPVFAKQLSYKCQSLFSLWSSFTKHSYLKIT